MRTPPSRRIVLAQWVSVSLLAIAGALNYVDRAALSVANKFIQEDLGIPVGKMGVLLSAFLWAYALSQLPAGALIDRLGARKLLTWGLMIWSVAQAACGFVASFGQFVVARAFLGIGEAPLFPLGARVVRDWFAVRERGVPIGICQASASLGSFIAIPLLTFLMLTVNWRWMFVVVGAFGILLALVWWALYRDPAEVDLSSQEVRYLTDDDENVTARKPSIEDWKPLLSHRTTWGIVAGFAGVIYTLWLYASWLPFYLEHERHLSVARAGIMASVPFFFGCVGGVIGGFLCDLLGRLGLPPMAGRKFLVSVALLGITGCTAGTAYCQNTTAILALISTSMFLTYVACSASWATIPIAAPSHLTGSLGAVQNFGGYIAGAFAPMLTGFIVQRTGGFSQALLLNAAITFVSAVAYIALVRGPIPSVMSEHTG